MRTLTIKKPGQYRLAILTIVRTVLKNHYRVKLGPFNSEFMQKNGQVDFIGRDEDKAWELCMRKLRELEVEVG